MLGQWDRTSAWKKYISLYKVIYDCWCPAAKGNPCSASIAIWTNKMSILKRRSKRKCSLRITYTNVYLKGAHLFVKCHVIFVWHRKVPLRCLVTCFGLWLNSSLKWSFLCHIAFVEVEDYFFLFPHGWLRFTHRSLPNLPLHASSFIIVS